MRISIKLHEKAIKQLNKTSWVSQKNKKNSKTIKHKENLYQTVLKNK